MSVRKSVSIVINDRDNQNQTVLGEVRFMTEDDAKFWTKSVQPYLEVDRSFGRGQDAHWLWKDKQYFLKFAKDTYGFTLCLKSAPLFPQGLMLVKAISAPRKSAYSGNIISYVDLIATADWNRPTDRLHSSPRAVYRARPGRYSGVGTVLLARALLLADELKLLTGIIGLHALPEAKPFYESLGMKNLGTDNEKENLDYFEFGSQEGKALLSGIRESVVNYAQSNSLPLTQIQTI